MAGFFMSIIWLTAGVEIFLSLQQSRNQNLSFGRRYIWLDITIRVIGQLQYLNCTA